MCFSATASFTASGILLVTGVACVSTVSKSSQLPLALTPLFFSIQQFSEGVLWSFFEKNDAEIIRNISILVFVIFGQSFWPVWVPLSALALEKENLRKTFLKFMLALGIVVSAILIYYTLIHGVTPEIRGGHIKFKFHYPEFVERLSFIYLLPAVFSNFFSSIRSINVLGGATFLGFFMSKIFFYHFVFSVWCFFAAVISLIVFFIIRSLKKGEATFLKN